MEVCLVTAPVVAEFTDADEVKSESCGGPLLSPNSAF